MNDLKGSAPAVPTARPFEPARLSPAIGKLAGAIGGGLGGLSLGDSKGGFGGLAGAGAGLLQGHGLGHGPTAKAPAKSPRPPSAADVLLGTGSLSHEDGHSGGGGLSTQSKAPAKTPAQAQAQVQAQAAAKADDGLYHSQYVGGFMAGITNGTDGARQSDREVNGRGGGYGYGVYGPSPQDKQVDVNATVDAGWFGKHTLHMDATMPLSKMDAVSDVAAVTQYAAAADQAIDLKKGADGKPQVSIDWQKLGEIPIQSNLQFDHNGKPIGGSQQITYDSPGAMAQKGSDAILENMRASGKDPGDKSQFVSITGHSGGGQSSFYTALKMASDGYKNVSVVGVDMAMTPHERKILETMGVKVTNITSHNTDDKGTHTSEVGEFIKIGMGGADNYYDLNVQRQSADALAKGGQTPADLAGRHSITNDANVTTMVRFAQFLDATGQHGNFSDEQYKQFLAQNKHGNEVQTEGKSGKLTADADLTSKFEDNRGKTGGNHRTEEDFRKWFSGFVKDAGTQMLPVPDQIGIGPFQYNAKDDLSGRLGDMAANNTPGMVGMLQGMGIDTTNIQGLRAYDSGSVSNHWGQFNNVDVPLPDWLNIDAK